MVNKPAIAITTCLLAITHTLPAQAENERLMFLGGWSGINDNDKPFTVGLEYQAGIWKEFYGLQPVAGGFVADDGSAYAYAGLQRPFELGANISLTPSFAAGVFGSGDEMDLGGELEFKSGIEVGFELANHHRLGMGLYHLSNARIYDRNPGTELFTINYSVPINSLW